jgi:hypothetical protein
MRVKYNVTPKPSAPPDSFTCYVELEGLPVLIITLPNNGKMLGDRLRSICKQEYPEHPFITWWMVDLD